MWASKNTPPYCGHSCGVVIAVFGRGIRCIPVSGICTKSVSSYSMSTFEILLLCDHASTCSDVNLARERKIPRRNTPNTGSPCTAHEQM